MKAVLWPACLGIICGIIFGHACLLTGCAAAQDSAYATARASCVSLATSHAQGETCFAQVQEMYCGDGGLFTTSDGGFCNPDGGAK